MVSGKYVSAFAEASHVLFEGHLDDPGFRNIAIQRIRLTPEGAFVAEESGRLPVLRDKGGEYVRLVYRSTYNVIFGGLEETEGRPFKDEHTPASQEPTNA